ncbi:class I SAM-dependent methyltransferase [Roseococcus sp. SYP-B2431]|uniref:class I SAM-dependent methyltransferase n=1 Tax=Roseococcus sp. SYP-B2431 TaxID=2496640 RepID=UPI0013F42953|nr:class I SAM-dependent methyltransferase [Roseococcus sp. SYP-B2431]
MDTLKQSVEVVAEAWKGSPYYDAADPYTYVWWEDDFPFHPRFRQLDLTATLELACGHGRHSERAAALAPRLVLMDILQENIDFCRTRLAGRPGIEFHRNTGYDFAPIGDGEMTAVFSYDSMVHFSPDIVRSYILDTARILAPGGRALYQHSNYDAPTDRHYGQNPHARNRMTEAMLRGFAAEAGLEILSTRALPWGGVEDLRNASLQAGTPPSSPEVVPDLDRLTLLQKPAR